MRKNRTKVYENHTLRIIDPFTCSNIKTLEFTRRRKRGRRGGRQVKLKYQINTQLKENGIDIKFLLLNSRSMRSKEFLMRKEIDSHDAEFVVVTETWLRNEHASWVSCSQFNCDGYRILTHDRKTRMGGSIALVYKEKYIVDIKETGHSNSSKPNLLNSC